MNPPKAIGINIKNWTIVKNNPKKNLAIFMFKTNLIINSITPNANIKIPFNISPSTLAASVYKSYPKNKSA